MYSKTAQKTLAHTVSLIDSPQIWNLTHLLFQVDQGQGRAWMGGWVKGRAYKRHGMT